MNFNYMGDMKYARLVCERAGLGLVIDPVNTQPRTDYTSIYLPPLDPTWPRNSVEYEQWWFYLLHESYHNKHIDDYDKLTEMNVQPKSFLGTINNITMDYKIETRNRGVFAGRDKLVKRARYRFASDYIYRDLGDGDGSDPRRAKMAAVWAHDALARTSWIPEYIDDNIPGMLGPEGSKWLDKILSFPDLHDAYCNQATAEDTYNVTIMLLKALEEDPDDPEVNEKPTEGDEGDGDGDEGEGGEGEDRGLKAADGWVKFSEMYVDDHDLTDNPDREHKLHIDYDVPDVDSWVPLPFFGKNLDQMYQDPLHDEQLEKEIRELTQQCNLSKKIRRELQAISRVRFESGKRRGRLHKRSLHKVMNDDDKLFKKRQVKFTPKSTAVMLLQDWSGSMGGTKLKCASAATHELARVLNSLRVPFAIEGFSTQGGHCNYGMEFKSFGESWNSDKFLHRCVVASHNMSSNADGDYILMAAGKLLKQKAARRILFVLSDGSPAAWDAYRNHGIMRFTQDVVKGMERMPGVEVYGIGIEDKNVEEIYRQNCTIDRVSELEPKLLNVLRTKIIQGMIK